MFVFLSVYLSVCLLVLFSFGHVVMSSLCLFVFLLCGIEAVGHEVVRFLGC